jgi:hypothetical protein
MDLGLLKGSGDALLGESVRTGVRYAEQLTPLVKPFPRKIDLLALTEVINEVMRLFNPGGKVGDRTLSDAWMGPRLHAALRLTRAEAAQDEVWFFLSAYAFPDYVRWRWTSEKGLGDHVFGTDVKKQAFKRLWWTTELFRNGPDYSWAERALSKSDIPNTLTALDAVHSRPVALGVLEFVEKRNVGSRQANDLAKQLNSSAVTVALDRAYVSQDEATELDEAWVAAEPDLQEIISGPVGPRHGAVRNPDIERVYEALCEIIDLDILRRYRQSARPNDNGSAE